MNTFQRIEALALILLAMLSAATARADVANGTVDVDHGRLYYETAGNGPAVVLIHGGQMDRRMWDSQFESYSKRFRMIRYDVRGYGRSARANEHNYSLPFRLLAALRNGVLIPLGLYSLAYSDVADLDALLIYLRIPKASIVGLSLGGRIAIDFALAHPRKVQSLVLTAPGLSGFEFSSDTLPIVNTAYAKGPAEAVKLWLKHPYMAPAMSNPAISGKIQRIANENSGVWLEPFGLERDPGPPAIHRLSEITAPTLIVVGDRDVPDIKKIVDLLVAGIPGAKKQVIEGSGHIVNMEKPEQFDKVTLEFLNAHSQ